MNGIYLIKSPIDPAIAVIGFFLAVLIWWDCTLQLGGLNENLYGNHSGWRTKTIKHLKFFFPRMNRMRSMKKIMPSELYILIYGFQIVIHTIFSLWLVNSVVCLILCLIGIEFNIMLYWGCFTLAAMFLGVIIVCIASFICYKECKRLKENHDVF